MIKKLLESLGKLLVDPKIHAAALCLTLLPLLFAAFAFFQQSAHIRDLQAHFAKMQHNAAANWRERLLKKEFLEKFASSDPYFINNYLESFTFLEKEAKTVSRLSQDPLFQNDLSLRARLQLLGEGENQLSFIEEKVKKSNLVQETEEHQAKPVETDLADLEKILSLTEGVAIGPYLPCEKQPQLIITYLRLEKNPEAEGIYFLTMDLLKREWLKKNKGSL